MSIPGPKAAIGDLRRFREVMTVLFEEGLSFFLDDLELHYLVPLRSRVRCAVSRGAEGCRRAFLGAEAGPPPEVRLRRAFERLGPSFVKLGQILSLRPDIVPPQYAREFAKLQDAVRPLAAGVAEKIVERELGQPIENLFKSFEERPLAAASLAQVHRATRRDGRRVAVKVRRPHVDEQIRTDIHVLGYLAGLLERSVAASRRFSPSRLAREFADWTLREIDFEVEGANVDRFRAMFEGDASIVIPSVHWDLTTRAVLVTDLVEGVKVDDLKGLEKAGIDRKALALVGLRAGMREFFIEGFFHADPHPGNLVGLPPAEEGAGPRLCLYDFGMVGTVPEKSRYELLACFSSFVEKDVEAYVRHVRDLAEPSVDADMDAFVREVTAIVSGVLYKPTERKGIAFAFYKVLLAGAAHRVRFPSDLVLLGKAFFTLETMGLSLYPEIDLEDAFRPFITEALKAELSPGRILASAKGEAFDAAYFLKHLPDRTRTLFERFENGEIGVKIDLQELHDLKAEFDRQNDVRVLALLAVALLVGSAIVLRVDERSAAYGWPLGAIGFAAAAALGAWLFVLIARKPRQ